ncbi:MAG: hypothetical protein P8Z81_03660 [Deinococcales bacterium]
MTYTLEGGGAVDDGYGYVAPDNAPARLTQGVSAHRHGPLPATD